MGISVELRRGGGRGSETRHIAPEQKEIEAGKWEEKKEVMWMWVSGQR